MDDLDHDLMRAFEAETVSLPSDDFIRQLKVTAMRRQRVRTALWSSFVVSLSLIGAFAAHALLAISLLVTEWLGHLLISPVGWVLSLLLGVGVARRGRLFRH